MFDSRITNDCYIRTWSNQFEMQNLKWGNYNISEVDPVPSPIIIDPHKWTVKQKTLQNVLFHSSFYYMLWVSRLKVC